MLADDSFYHPFLKVLSSVEGKGEKRHLVKNKKTIIKVCGVTDIYQQLINILNWLYTTNHVYDSPSLNIEWLW